jgi:hypothetical protein
MNIQEFGEKIGIPKRDTDAILVEIRANQKRLDECPKPHDFSIAIHRRTNEPMINPKPNETFGCKWRCSKCGGQVDFSDKGWYVRGLLDGQNSGIISTKQ